MINAIVPPARLWSIINSERVLFLILLTAYLIPLFQHRYFLTVDGPAHLYNARLIIELLKEPEGFVASFHDLSGLLKPNVLGHLFLAGILTAMPAFVAEKAILILMMLGIPLAGRYILSASGVRSTAFSFMLFPFTYSYLFYFGFYNFNLGVVLYLFALGVWIRYLHKGQTRAIWIMALLGLLIGLAHMFTYGILLITVFILNLHHILASRQNIIPIESDHLSSDPALMPGLAIIAISGIGGNEVGTAMRWLPIKDILVSLKYIMPIKGVQYDAYDLISRSLLYLLTLSTLFLVGRELLDRFKKQRPKLSMGPLAYLAASMLILVFVLPDETGGAGVISARMMHVFFILFILWMGTQYLPRAMQIALMICAGVVNLFILKHNLGAARSSDLADRIVQVSSFIPMNSILLPIIASHDPAHEHIGSYAGVEGGIVILKNYEADLSYFPITWDLQHFDNLMLGAIDPNECISWPTNANGARRIIDHILIIASPEVSDHLSCQLALRSDLDKYYTRADPLNDERFQLYRLRADRAYPGHIPETP